MEKTCWKKSNVGENSIFFLRRPSVRFESIDRFTDYISESSGVRFCT